MSKIIFSLVGGKDKKPKPEKPALNLSYNFKSRLCSILLA
jgi:hypothetical protein